MKKAYLMLLVLVVIALFWVAVSSFFTLQEIQQIAEESADFARDHPGQVFFSLVLGQALGMVLSLPTKALLTLLSGALLGPVVGSVTTLVGVFVGTTALFFAARYLLRDYVHRRLGPRARRVEERLSKRPIRALIGLRLFITLPYGPITLVSALTTMRYRDFILGSVIGDLPVVVVYTVAGKQLFELVSLNQAVSPWTLVTLLAAGLFFLATALIGKRREKDAGHR
jgi:uncharacterized membrane protein YdjX (TVP38/TMEM64 family)